MENFGWKIYSGKEQADPELADGEIHVKGIFSEKNGKFYNATLVMSDDGAKTVFSLDL